MDNLTLDLKTTALVVIDLQKGIAERTGLAPEDGQTIVKRNNELLAQLKNTPALIALIRVKNNGGERFTPATDQVSLGSNQPSQDFTAYSTAIANDVMADNVIKVNKHNWGAFYGTDLDVQLRRRGIKTVILTGIATSIGVDTTAREAAQAGYDLILVPEAMTDMSEEAHDLTVKHIFPRLGKIRTLAAIEAAIDLAKAAELH
ncbi:isochorismatase [Weissella oryzae SG25]|uniref:Isochorismatase n=1 Tax=Weissella oryzae (strain DSM 25784 / JCM 18191 / LMG 30913 / SG25) TaxID=1329250 RepID=A0A069CRV6_WEIOS|nr:isochorismatase family protein [Weissella oryzae]GAK30139.1 isochorismatase [Weissella oryzae SG25]